jgi:phosphonate degradation associated HDIG domain protein
MSLTLHAISKLLQDQGQKQYGMEAVNQLEHALQCAELAEKAGETPETIVAALLHDLGHMLVAHKQGQADIDTRKDDLHQFMALPFLRPLFPDAVLEPIRMHVDAKRYLCLIDSGYWADLSPASQHSLELQGGIFDAAQADAFMQQPFASEAVRLRRYDDLAKSPLTVTPPLSHFENYVSQVAI